MDGMTGRILALAGMMPPLVFPRSLQISRLLKALNASGWESTVITRLPESLPQATLDAELAILYEGGYRSLSIDTREDVQASPVPRRLWRKIRPVTDIDDDNWRLRAYSTLRKEAASGSYDVLVTFAQPWINHRIGLRLKRRNRTLPWIAHFSDPWFDSPYAKYADSETATRVRIAEQQVIEAADAVIFVTERTADLVMSKYPASWRDKVHVVPHGYDANLIPHIPVRERAPEVMRIVHTGNFYGLRRPEAVLAAIARLIGTEQTKLPFLMEFVGGVEEDLRRTTEEMGLADVVTFSGPAGYLDSLAAAASADLLLLLDAPAEENVFLPSKIVDYFMLKQPVLGITPIRGSSADVLRRTGCAVVAPDDIAAIASALHEAMEAWRLTGSAGPTPLSTEVARYDIHQIASEFRHVIEAVSARHRSVASANGKSTHPTCRASQ